MLPRFQGASEVQPGQLHFGQLCAYKENALYPWRGGGDGKRMLGFSTDKMEALCAGSTCTIHSDKSKCFQAVLDTSRALSLGVCHKPGVLTSKVILGPHQLGGYHDYHADHGNIKAQG